MPHMVTDPDLGTVMPETYNIFGFKPDMLTSFVPPRRAVLTLLFLDGNVQSLIMPAKNLLAAYSSKLRGSANITPELLKTLLLELGSARMTVPDLAAGGVEVHIVTSQPNDVLFIPAGHFVFHRCLNLQPAFGVWKSSLPATSGTVQQLTAIVTIKWHESVLPRKFMLGATFDL